MLSMKDEASFGGGGSSVNGLIGGVDRNLVVHLRNRGNGDSDATLNPEIISVVDRPFSIHKNEFVSKAKGRLMIPIHGTIARLGTIDFFRDTLKYATIDWTLPGSGQLSAPTVSGVVRRQVGSSLLAQLNKGYEVRAAKYDSLGTTPVGTAVRIALDADATKSTVSSIELSRSPGSGSNNVTGSMNGTALTAVLFDTVTGKETAPVSIPMAINTGTFTGEDVSSRNWNEQSATGSLPQGTVINMCRAVEYNGQYYLVPGTTYSHTITAAGGVGINGYSFNVTYSRGDSTIQFFAQAFYKLSTHSTWTALPGNNQNNIIANTFPQGGITINSGGVPITNTAFASRRLSFSSTPIPNTQRGLKLFLNGRRIYNSPQSWPEATNLSVSANSNGTWDITVSGQVVESPSAPVGAPRGDEFFQPNAPVVIDFNIAADSSAIGYRLYSRTADWNGSSFVYGAWRLAYDGPSATFNNWQGATLSNATLPNTNTTDNYPASRKIQLNFPNGVEKIDVMPGDSISVATVNQGANTYNGWNSNRGTILIPIEFGVE